MNGAIEFQEFVEMCGLVQMYPEHDPEDVIADYCYDHELYGENISDLYDRVMDYIGAA